MYTINHIKKYQLGHKTLLVSGKEWDKNPILLTKFRLATPIKLTIQWNIGAEALA